MTEEKENQINYFKYFIKSRSTFRNGGLIYAVIYTIHDLFLFQVDSLVP
jgi:hypothetical protein